jgi:hypothetical protein
VRYRFLSVVVCCSFLLLATAGAAQAYTELSDPAPSVGGEFGRSVTLTADGNTALVGEPSQSSGTGNVFEYTQSGGAWLASSSTVTASDSVTGDQFGSAVALSPDGSVAVVGAPGATVGTTTQAGKIYVFTQSAGVWTQVAEISNPQPVTGGEFGSAVSVANNGSSFIVSAPSNGTNFQGAAYIYNQSGSSWTQATSMTGLSADAFLGYTQVAMNQAGTEAAVGEPDNTFMSAGKTVHQPFVLVYANNGSGIWTLQKQIFSPGGNVNDQFGQGVLSFSATANPSLLIGAPGTFTINSQYVTGAGYLYTYSSGSWSAPTTFTIVGTSSARTGSLGTAGALTPDGSALTLSAPNGNASHTAGGGVAYQWTKTGSTWSTSPTLFSAADTGQSDSFGYALAQSAANHPFIGAPSHVIGGLNQAGTAYGF